MLSKENARAVKGRGCVQVNTPEEQAVMKAFWQRQHGGGRYHARGGVVCCAVNEVVPRYIRPPVFAGGLFL